MHRLFLFTFLIISFTNTIAQNRTWEKMKGPYGAWYQYLGIHPNGTWYVIASLEDGRHLLKSTDHGDSWITLPELPDDVKKDYFWGNSYNSWFTVGVGSDLYLGRQDSGWYKKRLYSSTDEGTTWKHIADSVDIVSITGKANECVIRRIDSGTVHYERITSDGKILNDTIPSERCVWVKDSMYAAIGYIKQDTGTLLLSTDDCKTWSIYADAPNKNAAETLTRTRYGDFLFVVGNGNNRIAYRGDFSGSGWKKIVDAATNGRIQPFGRDRVFGWDYKHWNQLYLTNPNSTDPHLIQIPQNEAYTEKNGWWWWAWWWYNIREDQDGSLIFGGFDALYRSIDTGKSWNAMTLAYQSVSNIQQTFDGNLYTKQNEWAWYSNHTPIYTSTDRGEKWNTMSPFGTRTYGYLGPGHDGGIITTVADSTSDDVGMDIWYYGGEVGIWTKLARLLPPGDGGPRIADFTLVDQMQNDYLCAGNRMYKSADRGKSWKDLLLTPSIYLTAATFSPSWKFYGAGYGGKMITSADGLVSRSSLPPIGTKSNAIITSIIAPTDSLLFVGTDQYGVYRSSNAGNTWAQVKGNWSDSITCLAFTKTGQVFIGTPESGLYSCDFKGERAKQEPLFVPSKRILSLYVDQGENDVYAGTRFAGLWKSDGRSADVLPESIEQDYHAEIIHSPENSTLLRITTQSQKTFDITLLDILGNELRRIPSVMLSNGSSIIPFDMENFAAGTYFIRLKESGRENVLKFIR